MSNSIGSKWPIMFLVFAAVVIIPAADASAQLFMRPTAVQEQAVTRALESSNSKTRKAAVAWIEKQLRIDPAWIITPLHKYWLSPLMTEGHYHTVAKLAMQGILAVPAGIGYTARLLNIRIQCLLALGRNRAALRNAKSLFNECALSVAGTALVILDQCLGVVYRKHPKIIQWFQTQERAGSAMPADTSEPMVRSGVMASIEVNAKPYLQRLAQIHGQSAGALLAKGNLLLLADQPYKAMKYFRRIEDFAFDKAQFMQAEKNIARAIKAEDGTVGRANAYLLQTFEAHPNQP